MCSLSSRSSEGAAKRWYSNTVVSVRQRNSYAPVFCHACACCKFRPLGSVADYRWIGSKPGDNVMLERRLHDGNDAEVTALPLPERFVVPFLQDTLTQQEFVRNLKRIQVLPSATSNTLAVLHSLLPPPLLINCNGLFRKAVPFTAKSGVRH